jgi:hypothetical protein
MAFLRFWRDSLKWVNEALAKGPSYAANETGLSAERDHAPFDGG